MKRCETCWPEQGCSLPPTFLTYSVEEYGDVPGQGPDREKAMMLEIFKRGPISCGICVTDELLEYKGIHYTLFFIQGRFVTETVTVI